MRNESKVEIEDLAELVAHEHWTSGRVDVIEIARAVGLTFSFGGYGDHFDGYLECKSRRFHIYVNLGLYKSADAPRPRFSFAHELGHYFIDWHRHALEHGAPSHGSKGEFVSGTEVEREADLFAANLLLPRDKLRQSASKRLGAAEIHSLASAFGASLSATAIRCATLSLAPLIVIKWSQAGRAWCWSSDRYAERTGNKSYRALERIPADSVTRQTLDAPVGNHPVRARGTTLSIWFPGIWAGSVQDDILLEECISLGQYGALTILRPA